MSEKKWDLSGTLVTMSTAIFALVSLVSVYISITTWEIQREAARPYFTFSESPSIHLTTHSNYCFEFKFKNVGSHPATNLFSRTLVFDQQLMQEPVLTDDYTVVNDIPRDTTTSLLLNLKSPELLGKQTIHPHYVIICLRYADPIIHKAYTQTIYLKWIGVIDGVRQPLIHVELSEKESIADYLTTNRLLE